MEIRITGSSIAVPRGNGMPSLTIRADIPLTHGTVVLGLADDNRSIDRPDGVQATFADATVDRL